MPDTFLLRVAGLCFAVPGRVLLHDLSFDIRPGLSFVRGGEGRGKSTLLRLLAGTLEPQAGEVHRHGSPVFLEDPRDPAADDMPARAWLESRRRHFADGDDGRAAGWVEDFGLAHHIDKPMFMLSTGSRRKVGLVAAAASGAAVTLLDAPFAALDAASCRVLVGLLTQAAADPQRAWVLADYELPAGLAGVPLTGFVDLGD